MILNCDCKNEYQDTIYGQGKRLFNPCKPKLISLGQNWFRCTVCKKEKLLEGKRK